MRIASKKSLTEPPQTGIQPGAAPTMSRPYKALAFNTLLSSQETDTHPQEPEPDPFRGNPSNLPDVHRMSTRSSGEDPTGNEVHPVPITSAQQTKACWSTTLGRRPRAGHLAASCIPFGLCAPAYLRPRSAQSVSSGTATPEADHLAMFRIPSGMENIMVIVEQRQIGTHCQRISPGQRHNRS